MRADQRLQSRMEEIPRQFFNGCNHKHSHPSKRVAQSIARQTGDGKAKPYKCRICKRWHNGHLFCASVGTAPLHWHQLPEPPHDSVARHGDWLCTAIEFDGSEDAEQIARKLAVALERTA